MGAEKVKHSGAIAGNCDLCGAGHKAAPKGWTLIDMTLGSQPVYAEPARRWGVCDKCAKKIEVFLDNMAGS